MGLVILTLLSKTHGGPKWKIYALCCQKFSAAYEAKKQIRAKRGNRDPHFYKVGAMTNSAWKDDEGTNGEA